MALPFWLTGYRINFKIFSKEHKAIMNWPLSNAYLLPSTLHRLHPNSACITLTDSCLFYISCLSLLFTLIFLLVTYLRIQIRYLFHCETTPEHPRTDCFSPLPHHCTLKYFHQCEQSMVPETISGEMRSQKYAHNNTKMLVYLSLSFSKECVFEP